MTQQRALSTRKRLSKPVLFGTLMFGLAVAFYNRHRFFEDVPELRAQERAQYNIKRMEVIERRQRLIEELQKNKHN